MAAKKRMKNAVPPKSPKCDLPTQDNIKFGTVAGDTAAFLAISNASILCVTELKKLDATGDGWTAKTSIPLARTSIANDAANCDTNALVAPYMIANGLGK